MVVLWNYTLYITFRLLKSGKQKTETFSTVWIQTPNLLLRSEAPPLTTRLPSHILIKGDNVLLITAESTWLGQSTDCSYGHQRCK